MLKAPIPGRSAFLLVMIVALSVRLVPNFILPMGAGYDIDSYRIVGDLVLGGEDVYSSPSAEKRHPYLPFQLYWLAFARWLSTIAHCPFVAVVRIAPILADVGISLLLLLHLWRQHPSGVALRGGLLYALNPIPVFVSAYHGQFDAIPALFLLLAVLSVDQSALASGLWLGLGILNKSWPVLGLPSLWSNLKSWPKRISLLSALSLMPALGMGVYLYFFPSRAGIVLKRALGYTWGVGIWGYTYLVRLSSNGELLPASLFAWLVNYGRYLTLAALGLVWLFRARKERAAASVLTVLVTFFAVTHAFSIQYLMWVIPFALLCREERWLRRYTLGAFAYMFLTYTTLILELHITNLLPWPQADWFIIMPAGLPVWLVTVGWARERLLGARM